MIYWNYSLENYKNVQHKNKKQSAQAQRRIAVPQDDGSPDP